jgi:FKBP-type peptidyl-prolyl cis-trans isomerase
MARDPGKTFQTARNLKLGTTSSTVQESLSLSDRVDTWKVNNKVRSSLNLALTGIAKKANADVTLFDGTGQVVARSKNKKNKPEKLNIQLETGTYYIQVKLKSGTPSEYSLKLSAQPLADQIGDTLATATALRGQQTQDFVGNSDLNDYLGFRSLVAGKFTLDMTGLSDDANVELLDSKGNVLAASNNPGTITENIQQRLTDIAGNAYYVRVFPTAGKQTSYTLNYALTYETTTKLDSGLEYIDITQGTGATPQKGQRVTVQYTGILTSGTKFDSSRDRNQPFSFNIGNGEVIAGWDEGLSSMKVGGRRQLIIPASLAYGSRGIGSIPPNATLIFDVELLGIS